jgi:hypothetical protein
MLVCHILLNIIILSVVNAEILNSFQVRDIWQPFNLTVSKFNVERLETTGRRKNIVDNVLADPPFNYSIRCNATVDICTKATLAYEMAGKKIASALRIRQTINIDVYIHSFCDGVANCDLQDVLGQSGASNFFPGYIGSDSSLTALYPQALVKQMHVNSNISDSYTPYDIEMEFNTDFDFWYPNDTIPINATQYDFEFVILHEITHGLGFSSGWTNYYEALYSPTYNYIQPNWLAPYIAYSSGSGYDFAFSNAFDLNLYSADGTWLMDLANDVYSAAPSRSVRTFFTNFQQNGFQPYSSAKKAYQVSTSSGQLYYRYNNTNQFRVFSPQAYQTGSTGSHFNYADYVSTADFLMVQALSHGRSFQSFLSNHESEMIGPYGPITMRTMSNMGWRWVNDTQVTSLNLAFDVIGIPRATTTAVRATVTATTTASTSSAATVTTTSSRAITSQIRFVLPTITLPVESSATRMSLSRGFGIIVMTIMFYLVV